VVACRAGGRGRSAVARGGGGRARGVEASRAACCVGEKNKTHRFKNRESRPAF